MHQGIRAVAPLAGATMKNNQLTPMQKRQFISFWRGQIKHAEKLQRKMAKPKKKLTPEQVDEVKFDYAQGLAYEWSATKLLDLLSKMGLTRDQIQLDILKRHKQAADRKKAKGKLKRKVK